MERRVLELGSQDKAWIDANITRGLQLCEPYVAAPDQTLLPGILDQAFSQLKANAQADEDAKKEIINALGCLFGVLMSREFGLQWRIVSDDFGTSLALVHSASTWETYPLDFVAKRVYSDKEEGSFFQAMHDLMRDELYRNK